MTSKRDNLNGDKKSCNGGVVVVRVGVSRQMY